MREAAILIILCGICAIAGFLFGVQYGREHPSEHFHLHIGSSGVKVDASGR